MTDKQERFCEEYMIDLNATQAAIRAGYSPKTANEQGSQLLAKLSIQNRIAQLQAVRALLNMEALKSSKDRTADIDKALEEAAKANPWAFGEAAEGGVRVSSGAEHGTPPTGDTDAVTAAFKAMNPGIKID